MNRLFTNNPAVRDAYPGTAHYIGGTVSDVFIAVRDAVHTGARILSHPLSGIKPWESPYKSIAVSLPPAAETKTTLHYPSLQLIEDALRRVSPCGQISRKREASGTDESLREDYRIIDLDLIKCAQEGLSCPISTTF
jgi:hypothetical protein